MTYSWCLVMHISMERIEARVELLQGKTILSRIFADSTTGAEAHIPTIRDLPGKVLTGMDRKR
jgi:hypothetical protein